MKIKLVPFGIAREILAGKPLELDVEEVQTAGDLRKYLESSHERFKELRSFRLAVGEEYRNDDFTLNENDEVVIIPPVSGG